MLHCKSLKPYKTRTKIISTYCFSPKYCHETGKCPLTKAEAGKCDFAGKYQRPKGPKDDD